MNISLEVFFDLSTSFNFRSSSDKKFVVKRLVFWIDDIQNEKQRKKNLMMHINPLNEKSLQLTFTYLLPALSTPF